MEKGYRAWGRDLTPDDTPLEAGLGFAVSWDKPVPWLGHEALAEQRARGVAKRQAIFTLDDPEPHAGRTPEQTAEAEERSAHLWRAIDALPEKLRVVTVLAAIEGHDMAEVSRLLDVPEGTVKWRLFAARKELQEKLQWLTGTTR